MIVEDNAHVHFEVFCHFAPGLIDFLDDLHEHLQACAGFRFFDEFFDQSDAGENNALTGASYMREQAMFDGVVLGAIGRVVSNADFDPQLIRQFLEVFFEDVEVGVIAAPAIAQSQDCCGLGINKASIPIPPGADTIASELAGVFAEA